MANFGERGSLQDHKFEDRLEENQDSHLLELI